jgi:hypothetical protein
MIVPVAFGLNGAIGAVSVDALVVRAAGTAGESVCARASCAASAWIDNKIAKTVFIALS